MFVIPGIEIKVVAILTTLLLIPPAAEALSVAARVVDSSGSEIILEKAYIEYEWSCVSGDPYAGNKYLTDRWRTDIILLQDAGTDELWRLGLQEIDSMSILPEAGKSTPLKGTVTVVLVDGRVIECKLRYWPLDAILPYLPSSLCGSKVLDLKRHLKGWGVNDKGKQGLVDLPLERVRAVSFKVSEEAQETQQEDRLRVLLLEKERLQKELRNIEAEIDSLIRK